MKYDLISRNSGTALHAEKPRCKIAPYAIISTDVPKKSQTTTTDDVMKTTQIDHFPLTEPVTCQEFKEAENRFRRQNNEKTLQGLDFKKAIPTAR